MGTTGPRENCHHTRSDRISLSFQYSTFDVLINHNALTIDVGRVNPGDFTTTSTRGAAGAGTLQLVTTGNAAQTGRTCLR